MTGLTPREAQALPLGTVVTFTYDAGRYDREVLVTRTGHLGAGRPDHLVTVEPGWKGGSPVTGRVHLTRIRGAVTAE